VLRDILKWIEDSVGSENSGDIYWSIENNNIGEAGLVVIKDIGEDQFPGLFVSEPMRKGHVRKFRKGFNTTHGSKIAACARLKHLVESDTFKIHSKPLIVELKAFIAHGVSFKAKVGEYDDLVSAVLLVVRMSQVLADWDPRVFDTLSSRGEFDHEDYEPPMPIFVSSGM
jgi:hypothetical protein